MKPEQIGIMDEKHLLYSLRGEEKELPSADGAVILLPSLTADFYVTSSPSGRRECADYYTAAVCAAAFLTLKRGLPLAEITFDTPDGSIEIFCTGGGLFTFNIPKCRLLSTESREIMGCEVKSADVFVKNRYRVIHTATDEGFDGKVLPTFLTEAHPMPTAVVHSYFGDGNLNFSAYCGQAVKKPTPLSLFAAAAYNAYFALGMGAHFTHGDTAASLTPSGVKITTGAFILK
ncbi:MAG: hypothetical protein J6V09_06550 [Clostridia bacterium]|nr:hypothetical protein [Clostridia bacterium]